MVSHIKIENGIYLHTFETLTKAKELIYKNKKAKVVNHFLSAKTKCKDCAKTSKLLGKIVGCENVCRTMTSKHFYLFPKTNEGTKSETQKVVEDA